MMYESMIIPEKQELQFMRALDRDWSLYYDHHSVVDAEYANFVVLHNPCMNNLINFRENLVAFSSFNSTSGGMKWKRKGNCHNCDTVMPLETTKKAIAMSTLLCPQWDE